MEDALQHIQFLLQYWPSPLFKVYDFNLIWKGVYDFLLVINCHLGFFSHRFRYTATYSLKHFIENYGQTASDGYHGYYWQPIGSRQRPIWWYHHRPSTTYRLAAIHPWQTDRQTDGRHIVPKTLYSIAVARQKVYKMFYFACIHGWP